ncbi:MAG: fumarate reductase/succinate dehydrogenase flavoprotein subunit, partial [Bacteroidales bacterium]|nr:fumarate reductase/succinate dehydrogenase flavoprotein subunit [Bacteroidales bacterium]
NTGKISTDTTEFDLAEKEVKNKIDNLMSIKGNTSAHTFHKKLGKIMWDYCGMARNENGLLKGLEEVTKLEEEFYKDLKITGDTKTINQSLERALRLAASFEISRLLIRDALNRKESCGAHFREEYQTPEGEALRNDEDYSYVAVWEYTGDGKEPKLHKEQLVYENVKVTQRSYK